MSRERGVCPVELAGILDSRFRRILQNPAKILTPFVRENMHVLDLGCGPGFFTVEMASLVGAKGTVYAVDLQQGMLDRLKAKISTTDLADRIVLHQCQQHGLRLPAKSGFDFILAFYVVHEIHAKDQLFSELAEHLKFNGKILVVEPPFHVSKRNFREMIQLAAQAGLTVTDHPKILFSKTALLEKTATVV